MRPASKGIGCPFHCWHMCSLALAADAKRLFCVTGEEPLWVRQRQSSSIARHEQVMQAASALLLHIIHMDRKSSPAHGGLKLLLLSVCGTLDAGRINTRSSLGRWTAAASCVSSRTLHLPYVVAGIRWLSRAFVSSSSLFHALHLDLRAACRRHRTSHPARAIPTVLRLMDLLTCNVRHRSSKA